MKKSTFSLAMALALSLVSTSHAAGYRGGRTAIEHTVTTPTLSQAEADGLLFMREEEKLARDVYNSLYVTWKNRVFFNISRSEQKHMDSMKVLLERYGLDDPAAGKAAGEFENAELQALYVQLVSEGFASEIAALMVGATIEEVDIIDIAERAAEVEGNDDIAVAYDNLMSGSRNHLRSFVRQLERVGVTYQPQYLNQLEYEAIIYSALETGHRSR